MNGSNPIWYTVSVTFAGEEFPRDATHNQELEVASGIFDKWCEHLLADESPLAERSAVVAMYEQHTTIGSLMPMRRLDVHQDGKYRIGYLATPDDINVSMYLRRKLAEVGVNDDHIPAMPAT